ncbi:hypothetical protein IC229_29850 [Spirosoma sp. BT702]|uniref:Uncharacterized protein n=1 Tax=Spirosoma profusum TaxID=2771354 RepID=A0A927G9V2_9BACT|nr:hypothetical protein [Spirosoma profusum]MBD2704873.1 hypothetical protein [Spirosoma profusum]
MNETLLGILNNAFWTALGTLLGLILPEFLKSRKKKRINDHVVKLIDSASNKSKVTTDIFVLESGDPFFCFEDIKIKDSDKELIISIPEEYHSELLLLKDDFEFRDQISFDGSKTFNDISESTKIENLSILIEKHKHIVSKNIINKLKANGNFFNGETLGIFRLRRDRLGVKEKSSFKVQTYRSDYFTQRIFASIYQELKSAGHKISKVHKLEELTSANADYSPFIGGIAATTLVLLNKGESVVVAERSEFIKTGLRRWHYTMDEGFSQTDYDDFGPSFVKCFNRGLFSELNITEEIAASFPPKFMDLIFYRNVFELEFTSIFEYPYTFDNFRKNYELAPDNKFETHNVKEIKLDQESVKKFIEENELMEGCKLSLQLLVIRKENGLLLNED